MSAALIPVASKLIGSFIERFIPDKDEANRLKAEAANYAMQHAQAEMEAASKIIVAEAGGDSWLQRNWRPMTMLWFTALVGAHWLGLTPENLSEAQVLGLLDIVQVGLGGYVVGRSVEKTMKAYKE